ncbi:fungal zn(2)-Cys(6) binuclear cluster domain-containing protein [Trichoderma breve]|uniref:Fungal zn(2)-Cys(6) binuclear cluster domain-containing protein n=1 Tax=Trichoderma breve TaxID=2034170 RepID=A0A9W9BFA5_9HYPO|nr:fungal zn(2)-Cys(6) binuclear cluster domain-containing protein [Trichoderma breve]KAJ4862060.1 fungal zn(2)-Cys(6) binuclear cluster domain-containing protein [Trichoderma breve]
MPQAPPAKKGRRRVKTGCQTCKKRRVKCDEGRPACQRCVSTGRVCDGYGIWVRRNQMQPLRNIVVMSQTRAIAGQPASLGFEYFRRYTTTKLPGLFESGFWDCLVLQASEQEPAVLHAVTALGAAHKNEERISLTEYNEAIRHLRHSLKRSDKEALRVCLITCMLFVCIELLRGGFKAGHAHLTNGLRILREIQQREGVTTSDGDIILRSQAVSVEDTLVEVFSRLNVQVALFGQVSSYLLFVGDSAESPRTYDIPQTFSSLLEARKYMDALINGSHILGEQASQLILSGQPIPEKLYEDQGRLEAALMRWLHALDSSHEKLINRADYRTKFAIPMLLLYHTMTRIMAATALRGTDEMIYDHYLPDFSLLIKQSADLWDLMRTAMKKALGLRGTSRPDINFTIDMGFIPPLYYALAKCRQPNLRRMILELLKEVPHREGAWDGFTVINMGDLLIEIEEEGMYEGFEIKPSCYLPDPSIAEVLPIIPASQRFNNVNVALPDFESGKATLFGRRQDNNNLR